MKRFLDRDCNGEATNALERISKAPKLLTKVKVFLDMTEVYSSISRQNQTDSLDFPVIAWESEEEEHHSQDILDNSTLLNAPESKSVDVSKVRGLYKKTLKRTISFSADLSSLARPHPNMVRPLFIYHSRY